MLMPGGTLVPLDEVIALLEAGYHPQNPVPDHPADFIGRMVEENRLPSYVHRPNREDL